MKVGLKACKGVVAVAVQELLLLLLLPYRNCCCCCCTGVAVIATVAVQ